MSGRPGFVIPAIILLAACSPPRASERPAFDAPKVSELQELATRDCQCRLAGHDKSRHGKEYARLTKALERERYATSSVPVSYESECFSALGKNACVLTGGYLPPDFDNFVCTEAQGIELEELWSESEASSASSEEADAAILERLERMRREASEAVSTSVCE